VLSDWLSSISRFWRDQRDENLRWQLSRQPEEAQLRQVRSLAEQALVARLKLQAQQLAHELAMTSVKQHNELAMLRIQCKQDLKDYQQYLLSLDKLKQSLRENFADLPEAVAFTIHHHAKQLLNAMWETRDVQQRLQIEMQLIRFMTAVHEDSAESLNSDKPAAVPQKTLAFLGQPNQIG
jgi:hypothetical protein